MARRLEIVSAIPDARAEVREKKLKSLGFNVSDVKIADVYTVEGNFSDRDIEEISKMLTNPVTEVRYMGGESGGLLPPGFDWAIETGFLPGVTDNVGNTVKESIEDLIKKGLKEGEGVFSSQLTFVSGDLSGEQAEEVGKSLANPLIQRLHIKNRDKYKRENGMDVIFPEVRLHEKGKANLVDILNADNTELQRIGKMGIPDRDKELTEREYADAVLASVNDKLRRGDIFERDGKFYMKIRRGPLAQDLTGMKAIQEYFKKEGRNPFDIEVESIAQTWSEHCKHTLFANPLDEIKGGLFRDHIRAATEKIRKAKGDKDFCVSVFKDNSGIITFDDNYYICIKVETHNSPSALDPFGGSITGIVGVNRDPMGTGLGAKPFLNLSGPFCFGYPEDIRALYKAVGLNQRMLLPRQIMDGVIDGVRVGGNCSGIPTSHFRLIFDDRYRGKPLVYVGTLGVMPRESAGRRIEEKAAMPGDYIVMVGGRVGKDGIHGATFSSEALDTGSPMGAVQIGDPITQKKESDALIKEARDRKLYRSITDNGAGGLSCSVSEMAQESGGYIVDIGKVPLKYPGLRDDETWISEAQERMTLAVPAEKWEEFESLMKSRDVEATVIGEFTNSGRAIVKSRGETIMDIDMDFLHNGVPIREMKSKEPRIEVSEPDIPVRKDLTPSLIEILGRHNIASQEFIARQYDHEVQGGSVMKPLQGRGRVLGDVTITRPVLDSMKGVAVSQGINPSYSDINCYDMAAAAIDTAVRNLIAAGVSLDKIALLDNFCWPSGNEPERLYQLKQATQACYDVSVAYGTPFVSGKDSMHNDFKGFDENGNPIKISVPPTLLVTGVGVMDDVRNSVSLDAKFAGDLVYVLGTTFDELGGSEYYAMEGNRQGERFVGKRAPVTDPVDNMRVYRNLHKAISQGLVASSQSVHVGGLGVALAKTAMGGKLGMDLDLKGLRYTGEREDNALFSESSGRIVVTVDPVAADRFEYVIGENDFSVLGRVSDNQGFRVKGLDSRTVVNTDVSAMLESYRGRFKDF